MECNKDEAIRAKQLAEKKLTEKDILGAKRLAVKAQSLFPGLDGLSQFQEILDVYASSQKKVNGEIDWYEIFGVDPLADNETIRKKYRKLALALHPDKNKSVGADGAFKIMSEAWSLLSDKAKRDAYNERRNIRAPYQRASNGYPPTGPEKSTSKNFTHSSSKPRNPTAREKFQPDTKTSYYKDGKGKTSPSNAGNSRYNSFSNCSSTTNPATQGKAQQETRPSHEKDRGGNSASITGKSSSGNFTGSSSSKKNSATPNDVQQDTRTSYQKATNRSRNVATSKNSHTVPSAPCGVNCSKTFWTSCNACKMQYEYVSIYRNKKLLCPTCRKPFMAREMAPPCSMPYTQKQQGSNHNCFDTSSNSGRKSMGASGCSSFKSLGRADIPPVSPSARSESRTVKSASKPAQNLQSTNVNLKRRHEQEVDVACRKRTAPVKPGSDTRVNFAKGVEMASKRRPA